MPTTVSATSRDQLLTAWFEETIARYSEETARFMRCGGDPFQNPVGTSLQQELRTVLEGVLDDRDPAELDSAIDRIVRVRAVQDLSASAAVGFVFDLKKVLRQSLGDGVDHRQLEARIDRVALRAFDVYAACRDQVAEIRIASIRSRSVDVLERFNAWQERRHPEVARELEEGGES